MGYLWGFVWVEWPFLLCVLEVVCFAGVSLAVLIIYENRGKHRYESSGKEPEQELDRNQLWECCFGRLHPGWLLAFRVFCFCYMAATQLYDLIKRGPSVYIFYTQWMFTLFIIYFMLTTWISVKEVYNLRRRNAHHDQIARLLEEGSSSSGHGDRPAAGFLGFLALLFFQVVAPAVLMTVSLYWLIIVPTVYGTSYYVTFTSFSMHALSFLFLIGEFLLNSLPFPWFRGGYFILLSAVFVIFQWVLHLTGVIRLWPYSFLNVSSRWAPLWYLGLGTHHLFVYYLCTVVAKGRRSLVSYISER